MRKISYIFLIVGLMASTFAYAQKKQKPNLNKVTALVNKGKTENLSAEDLMTAKDIVELATEYEKTKDKTKTWYLRGSVYRLIYESESDFAGISKENALETSAASFQKAAELGNESDTYVFLSGQEVNSLWTTVLNDGVNAYQAEDLDKALQYFTYVTLVKPADTTGYLYAASAASQAKKYDVAIQNYQKLVKINPNEETYLFLISLQKDVEKDLDAAIATIAEARSALGEDNQEINKVEIDILIATDKVDQALTSIDKAIEAEPENALLHLRKGLLYDQLVTAELDEEEVDNDKVKEYTDKAEEAYKKTLEYDPDNITAYFNYAVIYSNKANIYFKEANMMTPDEYRRKGADLNKKGKEILAKGVPLMEKARELEPDDRDVLYALQNFYSRLNYADKLKEVNAKLKELGYED